MCSARHIMMLVFVSQPSMLLDLQVSRPPGMLHLPGSCAAARMFFLRRFASDELPMIPKLGAGTRNGIKARLRSCTQDVVGLQWCMSWSARRVCPAG